MNCLLCIGHGFYPVISFLICPGTEEICLAVRAIATDAKCTLHVYVCVIDCLIATDIKCTLHVYECVCAIDL